MVLISTSGLLQKETCYRAEAADSSAFSGRAPIPTHPNQSESTPYGTPAAHTLLDVIAEIGGYFLIVADPTAPGVPAPAPKTPAQPFRQIANLADKSEAGKVIVRVDGDLQEGHDPLWLRNAVEEPLDEADIEWMPDGDSNEE